MTEECFNRHHSTGGICCNNVFLSSRENTSGIFNECTVLCPIKDNEGFGGP